MFKEYLMKCFFFGIIVIRKKGCLEFFFINCCLFMIRYDMQFVSMKLYDKFKINFFNNNNKIYDE